MFDLSAFNGYIFLSLHYIASPKGYRVCVSERAEKIGCHVPKQRISRAVVLRFCGFI